MSEPKFKLGDDGELEEIIEDFDEKPKRKRKPYNRTLYIPMSLMLVLIASILLLVFITFSVVHPTTILASPTASSTLFPSQTPFGWLGQLPLCSSLALTNTARFVYQLGSDKGNEILRMNVNGTNACRVTDNTDIDDAQPTFSPDGSKIVFVRPDYKANDSEIYVMDSDGNNIKKLTDKFDATDSPKWSPDGEKIAFSGRLKSGEYLEIYTMNADGSNLVNVTNHPSNNLNLDWSPDGKSIVFSSNRTFPNQVKLWANKIYVMSPDGSNLKQLTFSDQTDISPSWSPDGEQILFYSEHAIYIMDKNGGNQRQMIAGDDISFSWLFWMPDGQEIGFKLYSHSRSIQLMNIRSGQIRTLPIPTGTDFITKESPVKSP